MPFNTNILKTHTARQALGAVVGMLAAALLYVTFDQMSSRNLSGLLIDSTSNISQNAGQVSVNDKNISDSDLRTVAMRAKAVADALKQSAQNSYEPAAVQTPVNERAAERRAKRVFANQLTAENETAQVFPVAKFPEEPEQRDRIEARNAEVVAIRADTATHPGAPAGSLPNSGLGLNLLIVIAAIGAFAAMKKDVRDRLLGVFADIV